MLGTFMAFVDATIVNIAIPSIAREFSGSRLSSVSWVLNAYNIVFAAFLVGGGQLADLLGRRRVFTFALVLFTLSSALCAAAPTLGVLVLARILQAAGAAMLVPSSLAIVLAAHADSERTHAIALWSAVAALAAGIGPPLGGFLMTISDWRVVFLVNIPVGAVAVVLAHRVLIESRSPGRRRMPDLLGGLILALAVASLVLAVVKGSEWGWSSAEVIGCFLAARAAHAGFVRRTAAHPNPLVDLKLFSGRGFAVPNGVTLAMSAGFYAYTLCNVLFLTTVWRYSVLQAGLALTPGPFTAIAVAGFSSRLVKRYGPRRVAVPGALIWAAGMAYFIEVLGVSPDFLGRWLPGMILLGIGAGFTFPTLSGVAVGAVPGTRFAMATALNSVARQIGAALGVAILIAILGTPAPAHLLRRSARLDLRGRLFPSRCGRLPGAGRDGPRRGGAVAGVRRGGAQRPGGRGAGARRPRAARLLPGRAGRARAADRADFLRLVPVFSALPAQVVEELADVATDVSCRPVSGCSSRARRPTPSTSCGSASSR